MKRWELAPQPNKTMQDFEAIQFYWRWFRERCMRLYGLEALPEAFGEQEGRIIEHQWVDPEEDWTAPPPEYNHDWRTQELSWKSRGYQVSFTRNDDVYSNYVRFELKGLRCPIKSRTRLHWTVPTRGARVSPLRVKCVSRRQSQSPRQDTSKVYIKLRISQRGKGEVILEDNEERCQVWERELRALTEPHSPLR